MRKLLRAVQNGGGGGVSGRLKRFRRHPLDGRAPHPATEWSMAAGALQTVFVFAQAIRKKVPWKAALPFAINLVANVIFTPIQFGLRNLPLAAMDILLVWATIIWMVVAIWKHYR